MLEHFGDQRDEKTYNLSVQTSIIRSLDDCMIEIIRITFVIVLKFVEEVEKLEGEGSRWPNDRCGEPACAKELVTTSNTGRCTTVTVSDDNTMNAVQIEDHQVIEGRGGGARVAWGVAELNRATERGEGR